MATPTIVPPAGFTLDTPQQSAPQPPPGFKLDTPQAAAPAEQPGPVARFAKNAWDQVNPVEGVKGLAQLTSHPIDTLTAAGGQMGKLQQEAAEAWKRGDIGTAAAKALYSIVPFMGPQLAKSGDQMESGDVAGGLGTMAGVGANIAAPELLKGVKIPNAVGNAADGLAEKLYTSALKPSTTIKPAKVARAVQAGLKDGVTVGASGIDRIGDLVDDLNTKISDQIQASGPNRVISPSKSAQYTRDAEAKFANQVNPKADLAAIADSRDEFLDGLRSTPGGAVRNMTAEEAQAMKQGTYKQLGSKAYGELKTATVEAQKALARGLKDSLAEQFPELAGLNAKEGALLDLQPILERRVRAVSNHQLIGIGTPVVMAAAGKGAALAKAIFDNPVVKSKLAIALSKARGGMPMPVARAKIAGYINSLGEGAEQSTSAMSDLPKAASTDDQNGPLPVQDLTDAAKRKAGFDPSIRLQEYAKP